MSRQFLILTFGLWTAVSAFNLAAGEPPARSGRVQLRPLPGSDLVFDSLELVRFPGGRILQGHWRTTQPPEPTLYRESRTFFFRVDPMNATYMVVAGDRSLWTLEGNPQEAPEVFSTSSLVTDPSLRPIGDPGDGEQIAPGGGEPDGFRCTEERHARITTRDPVLIALTYSRTYLRWVHDTCTNEVSALDTDGGCWAANPSSLGTHWYVESCKGSLRQNTPEDLRRDTFGRFYNYDFLDDDDITRVVSSATVTVQGTFVDTFFSYFDEGEASTLLWGDFSFSAARLGCVGYVR